MAAIACAFLMAAAWAESIGGVGDVTPPPEAFGLEVSAVTLAALLACLAALAAFSRICWPVMVVLPVPAPPLEGSCCS